MTAAGSPGVRRSRPKTTSATTPMTGMVAASRRTMSRGAVGDAATRPDAPRGDSTDTFQYKLAGKVSTPFTFLRYAVGCVYWPHGTYGTSS